jgi:hypothetical protein
MAEVTIRSAIGYIAANPRLMSVDCYEVRLRPSLRRSRDCRTQVGRVSLTHSGRSRMEGFYIKKINGPFIYELKGLPAEYKAGLDLAIANGWLELHESGTFVKFTEAGAALFA